MCWISILFAGCLPQKTVTNWKTEHIIMPVPNKIMVVGIIKANNDSLRAEVETILVKNLKELGYNAVSALHEFGPKGLSNLGEESTYIKLCDNGIDAVLTFALIDKVKQTKYRPGNFSAGTSYYYYNRIWNYQKMQAILPGIDSAHGNYLWESILFDLNALEPLCVIQTRPFKPGQENKASYVYQVLEGMKKGKILARQKSLKPF